MMKQFAFAATLSAMTMAMGSPNPKLVISYESTTENYFLGLERDNPTTLKMPKDRRTRSTSCAGWQLQDETAAYTSFDLVIDGPEEGEQGCTKYILSTKADAAQNAAEEQVIFFNDCGDEIETLTIDVQVYN